jgi:hypothetical protein
MKAKPNSSNCIVPRQKYFSKVIPFFFGGGRGEILVKLNSQQVSFSERFLPLLFTFSDK